MSWRKAKEIIDAEFSYCVWICAQHAWSLEVVAKARNSSSIALVKFHEGVKITQHYISYNMQRGTIILFQFFLHSDKKHHGIIRKSSQEHKFHYLK
jgi:hypothetical protein